MIANRIRRSLSAALFPGKSPRFHLDTPHITPGGLHRTASPLHVSGWVTPPAGGSVRSLDILIDGELVARATGRAYLPRVAKVLPGRASQTRSAFSTEVVLDRWMGRTAEMALVVNTGEKPEVLTRIAISVEERVGEQPRRERSFRLEDVLACPDCQAGNLELEPEQVHCARCGVAYQVIRGTPLFAPPSVPVGSRLLEPHHTHPYSDDSLALIHRYRDGIVLDFGAGHPRLDFHFPHVLLHEAVHYDQIDVVSLTSRLPYRDNSFDAVISQAVFEHVPRPWDVAMELHRVLKPGGEIHLDTAFMQPFHSDPDHYFNMTIPGIREIFRPFRELRVGVKPYQLPSFGLRMQLEVMLQHLQQGEWNNRMRSLLEELQRDGCGLDEALGPDGRNNLAAGVYFHGVKEQ